MRSYASRHGLDDFRALLLASQKLVDKISDSYGDELRCHELAIAVRECLDDPRLSVVDGHCGSLIRIEHSWIEIRDSQRRAILDVYTPGREPQAQLIVADVVVSHDYEIGRARDDVDYDLVRRLVEEMRR